MLLESGKVVLDRKKLAMAAVATLVVGAVLGQAIRKVWVSQAEDEEGAKSIKDRVREFLMA